MDVCLQGVNSCHFCATGVDFTPPLGLPFSLPVNEGSGSPRLCQGISGQINEMLRVNVTLENIGAIKMARGYDWRVSRLSREDLSPFGL